MRTDIKRFIYKFLVVSFSSLIVFSCEKKSEEPKTVITVTTSSISQITQTSAKSGGSMTITGNATIDGKGICWSTSNNPTVSLSPKTADGTGSSSYTSSLTGLTPSTTYYVRAYATYSEGIVYGNELTFTTGAVVLPTVTTSSATNITQTTATVGGSVTSDGGATVTERGVCYSTNQNPTVDNSKVQSGSGAGSYTVNLTGLSVNTSYYARAYAKNSQGVNYGSQTTFKTLPPATLATVTTSDASEISLNSVKIGGTITSNGNTNIYQYGVCYSKTNTSPTASDECVYVTSNFNVNTPYSFNVSNLQPNSKYYYRAVVSNIAGISYGEVKEFTTSNITVGMSYQGGIVAYIFKSGENGYVAGEVHGLIVATSDQGTAMWSNNFVSITTSTSLGLGKTNTDNIIASQGEGNYAAKLCRNLGADWFLPSYSELRRISTNRTPNMGFKLEPYWTSSSYSNNQAWAVDFNTATEFGSYRTTIFNVRAVKYF